MNINTIKTENEKTPASLSSLVPSFWETLQNDASRQAMSEFAEVGFDGLLESDLAKSIPIVSLVSGLYRTGLQLMERHFLRETAMFIDGFSKGNLPTADEDTYKSRILRSEKDFSKEIERILFLLQAHRYSQQSRRLGSFYKAYLSNVITWTMFCELSEANHLLFESDYVYLQKAESGIKACNPDWHLERLSGLGLILDSGPKPENGALRINERNYRCSPLGVAFLTCSNFTS